MDKKIVVFAPHLDDETLNCGGTIADEINGGTGVSVVYMTDGRNSHLIDLGISKDPTPDEVAEKRNEEVFAATAELGIPPANLTFLNFPDGKLGDDMANARERVIEFLRGNWPVAIYIPARGDKHPDHVATNEIVWDAIRTIHKPVTVYEYVTWTRREVAGVTGPQRDTPDGEELIHDISGSLAAKNAAIDRYASQITLLWSSQDRPVLDENFLKPFREGTTEIFRQYKLC